MVDKPLKAVALCTKEYPWQMLGLAFCLFRIACRFVVGCCVFGVVHVIEKILGRRICP